MIASLWCFVSENKFDNKNTETGVKLPYHSVKQLE